VIASPAPSFFSIPVVVSGDPEVPGVAANSGPDQAALGALVRAGGSGDWGQVLATVGSKYVLVAKEVDWRSYEYLDSQPDLVRVADLGSIVVYRNQRFR
jgi:hypothetical protein